MIVFTKVLMHWKMWKKWVCEFYS